MTTTQTKKNRLIKSTIQMKPQPKQKMKTTIKQKFQKKKN